MAQEHDTQTTEGEFTFLREHRERLGLSIDEVAEAIGMDAEHYALCERNPMPLDFDEVEMLGDLLGFKFVDLARALESFRRPSK